MSNKFRNQSNGRYLAALFYEQTGADKATVVYTLKDEDHQGYPSLYRLYMDVADPTEYQFSRLHLDGWEHWEMLCNCAWFEPYVTRWRKELELKIKSEALSNIIAESKTTSSNAYQAAKFLVNGEWIEKPKNAKGRPTKTEVRSEAKRIAEDHFRITQDFERIQKGLN